MTEQTIEQLAEEILAIPAISDDELRLALKESQSLLDRRNAAQKALSALGNEDADWVLDAAAKLPARIMQTGNEMRHLKRAFVDRVLIPLTERAMPSSPYPFIFGMARYSGGDMAGNNYHMKCAMDWCAERPNSVNALTVCEVTCPYDENSRAVSIYDQPTANLLRLHTWMVERAEDADKRAVKAQEKADRKRALKLLNRERANKGLHTLPDPDTRKGFDEIKQASRKVSDKSTYIYENYYTKDFSEEDFARARIEHAQALAIFNEFVYGTSEPDNAYPMNHWR